MQTTEQGSLLVVDDNALNRDILARRLEQRGYTVTVAEEGQQALNVILQQKFDLVLLDIEMPGIDGIMVLSLLRKTYSMAELPVIMVTAKGESADVVRALELGANDYIMKPIDFAVAFARIRTQLSLKYSNDEINKLAKELEGRNILLRSIFGRYVDTGVVERLLQSPEALKSHGEERAITILFADLRDFTLISENLPPDRVLTMLNNFLGPMIDIVGRYNGVIDELLGDGLLAFFGAPLPVPDHAQQAIACAIEMQLAMEAINIKSRQENLPLLKMGIGIHTGEVIVGNIGSETRSKYSVVGTNVNFASRLESYSAGGQILISEATLAEAGAVVRIDGRVAIHPRGVANPAVVYEAGGIAGQHGLFLPTEEASLKTLEKEVPLVFIVRDKKHDSSVATRGHLIKISINGGEIRCADQVPAFSDIEIHFDDDPDGAPFCGKVLSRAASSRNGFYVRFASMHLEALDRLSQLYK